MIDFDVILGMYRLHTCYTFIDCRNRVLKFQFPNKPVLEWRGSLAMPKSRLISYLKTKKLIPKGCAYHIAKVKDFGIETPPLQYVLIINEFFVVFPDDLPRVPSNRKIAFGINILPNT